MLKIDKAILEADKVICKNISKFDTSERGLLSQNILSQLRNFVEYISYKIYADGDDIEPYNRDINVKALKNLKTKGNVRFIYVFHELLQKSVSHYTLDEDSSERLMLKYYEYLLKIKIFLRDNYRLDVLNNIDEFPLNTDTELEEYYMKIAEKIEKPSLYCNNKSYSDRYYIQKVKPFFVNQKIYYEVTFTVANGKTSKFDRVIAFTKHDIQKNYAVKLIIHNDVINILEKNMSIQVIDDWSVSIRQCELANFAKIIGSNYQITSGTKEYNGLMNFLTKTQMPLSELMLCSDEYYNYVRSSIIELGRTTHIFNVFDKCREIILKKCPGSNVIMYFLYHMNNTIIKAQKDIKPCPKLSNLYLSYKCIPFDKMPFCSGLRKHNPKIFDLLDCMSTKEREHEFLARFIQNNTEIEGCLFTNRNDIKMFGDIDSLIKTYNSKLYLPKHDNRRLMIFNGFVYIKGYVDDSTFIIKKLCEMSQSGVAQYTNSVDSWLKNVSYIIDCPEKKKALRTMFSYSRVSLIYGSAGTGKSTLINHVSNFFLNYKKLFLANTHPAVHNMRRKVTAGNSEFRTIASFKSNKNMNRECDVLIIDECSTVSNSDMREVLEKAKFKLLILVGDVYQIESIRFGNWFDIAREFISINSIFELKKPYRTQNESLLLIWERVRNIDKAILEPLVKNGYSIKLDESIFSKSKKDEIILCLNYDGLYGINNINRLLQNNNQNPAIQWGIGVYKIGDPILFNELERFSPLIYNNSKGTIIGIKIEENKIWFDIELDFVINELDAQGYDFDLLDLSNDGNSIIRFSVNKDRGTDEDDDSFDVVVPFQIAYAVSIHKAQGLEYSSVKIVITNETEERITHNIFYTAITRAKQTLKIYWSPETEKSVLEKLSLKNSISDANLLKKLMHSQ